MSLTSELEALNQRTGSSTGGLATAAERAAFQRAVRLDISSTMGQVNNVYNVLVTSLSTVVGLDALDFGISGNIIFTDVVATASSANVYWDSGNARARTIKETVDVLLAEIVRLDNIVASVAAPAAYDHTTMLSDIAANDLDLDQLSLDAMGVNYTLDGDGNANLTYSLSQALDALGAFFTGWPGTGNTYGGAYPALSFAVAPVGASYITIGLDATLTAERNLAVTGTHLTLVDSGANAAVTLGLASTAVTPGSYTSANLTVDAQGRITSAATGVAGGEDLEATLILGSITNGQNITVSDTDVIYYGDTEVQTYYDPARLSGVGEYNIKLLGKEDTGSWYVPGVSIGGFDSIATALAGVSGQVIISSAGLIPGVAGSTATTGIAALLSGSTFSSAGTAGDTGAVLVQSGNSGDAASGSVTVESGAGGTNSGNVLITSGDAAGGSSGNVDITVGTATGTRGHINILAPAFDSSGETDFEFIVAESDNAFKIRNTGKPHSAISLETKSDPFNDILRLGPITADVSTVAGEDRPTVVQVSQHSILNADFINIEERVVLEESFTLAPGTSAAAPSAVENKHFYLSGVGAPTSTFGSNRLLAITGTTANDTAVILPTSFGGNRWGFAGGYNTVYKNSFGLNGITITNTLARYEFGIRTTRTAFDDVTDADKIIVRWDSSVHANWHLVTSKAGTDTLTDLGVATMKNCRVMLIGDDVYAYVENELKAVVVSAMTSTSTALGHPYIAAKTLTTAGKSIGFSKFVVGIDLSAS